MGGARIPGGQFPREVVLKLAAEGDSRWFSDKDSALPLQGAQVDPCSGN